MRRVPALRVVYLTMIAVESLVKVAAFKAILSHTRQSIMVAHSGELRTMGLAAHAMTKN